MLTKREKSIRVLRLRALVDTLRGLPGDGGRLAYDLVRDAIKECTYVETMLRCAAITGADLGISITAMQQTFVRLNLEPLVDADFIMAQVPNNIHEVTVAVLRLEVIETMLNGIADNVPTTTHAPRIKKAVAEWKAMLEKMVPTLEDDDIPF